MKKKTSIHGHFAKTHGHFRSFHGHLSKNLLLHDISKHNNNNVGDTGGKFTAGVIDICHHFTEIDNDRGHTGGKKFAPGVNGAGCKMPSISSSPRNC
jgi:hypothetical protein